MHETAVFCHLVRHGNLVDFWMNPSGYDAAVVEGVIACGTNLAIIVDCGIPSDERDSMRKVAMLEPKHDVADDVLAAVVIRIVAEPHVPKVADKFEVSEAALRHLHGTTIVVVEVGTGDCVALVLALVDGGDSLHDVGIGPVIACVTETLGDAGNRDVVRVDEVAYAVLVPEAEPLSLRLVIQDAVALELRDAGAADDVAVQSIGVEPSGHP